jgi:hypothetical protein
MSLSPVWTLVAGLLAAGCGPAPPPEPNSTRKPQQAKTGQEQQLRRAVGRMQSCLGDLEGRLRLSQAQTWSQEASAAQQTLGQIRMEIGALRAGSKNVAPLDSLLSDLEGRLRGASLDNWSRNASAAQRLVGDLRIALQNLSREL